MAPPAPIVDHIERSSSSVSFNFASLSDSGSLVSSNQLLRARHPIHQIYQDCCLAIYFKKGEKNIKKKNKETYEVKLKYKPRRETEASEGVGMERSLSLIVRSTRRKKPGSDRYSFRKILAFRSFQVL